MTTQPFSETVTGIGPPWLLYDQVRMYNRGVARGKGRRAGEGDRLAPGGGSAVSRWVIGPGPTGGRGRSTVRPENPGGGGSIPSLPTNGTSTCPGQFGEL